MAASTVSSPSGRFVAAAVFWYPADQSGETSMRSGTSRSRPATLYARISQFVGIDVDVAGVEREINQIAVAAGASTEHVTEGDTGDLVGQLAFQWEEGHRGRGPQAGHIADRGSDFAPFDLADLGGVVGGEIQPKTAARWPAIVAVIRQFEPWRPPVKVPTFWSR